MATVLVVDDLPDARYSIAHPLASAGFDVRETATGRDALRLAREQPDAIVLDIVYAIWMASTYCVGWRNL